MPFLGTMKYFSRTKWAWVFIVLITTCKGTVELSPIIAFKCIAVGRICWIYHVAHSFLLSIYFSPDTMRIMFCDFAAVWRICLMSEPLCPVLTDNWQTCFVPFQLKHVLHHTELLVECNLGHVSRRSNPELKWHTGLCVKRVSDTLQTQKKTTTTKPNLNTHYSSLIHYL